MNNGVHAAVSHLPSGDGIGIGRVQDGRSGEKRFGTNIEFLFGFLIGQHCAAVHFGGTGGQGQDDINGQGPGDSGFVDEVIPDIALIIKAGSDRLRRINHTSTANRQQAIHLLFPRQVNGFTDKADDRIGFNAAFFNKAHALFFQ